MEVEQIRVKQTNKQNQTNSKCTETIFVIGWNAQTKLKTQYSDI